MKVLNGKWYEPKMIMTYAMLFPAENTVTGNPVPERHAAPFKAILPREHPRKPDRYYDSDQSAVNQ